MDQEPFLAFDDELSGALRVLIEQQRAALDTVSRRTVDRIKASVPDYSLSVDPKIEIDMYDSTCRNATLWFDALLNHRPLTAETLSPVVAFARRRVHQGVTLSGLLRGFRIMSRSFWTELLDAAGSEGSLHAELLLKISPYLLQHFDIVAERIATTYLREQSEHARWRDRLRQELWMVISSRPDDSAAFCAHAESLGLGPSAPHTALVFRFRLGDKSSVESFADSCLAALARRLLANPDRLMRAVHRDHLVAWIPTPASHSAVVFEQELSQLAVAMLPSDTSIAAIGIGLPGIGAHGWRSSMEQGLRTLADAENTGVFRFSKIILDDAVAVSANASSFMAAMIDCLKAEPSLIETLRSYFANHQHRKATAADLCIHPNTLDHRLSRIEALLDGHFNDIDWLARLHTALRLHQGRV